MSKWWLIGLLVTVFSACSEKDYEFFLDGNVRYSVDYDYTNFSSKFTYLVKLGNHRIQKIVLYEIAIEDYDYSSRELYISNGIRFKRTGKKESESFEGEFKISRYGKPQKKISSPSTERRNQLVRTNPVQSTQPIRYVNPFYYNERLVFSKDGTWKVYYKSTASDSPMSYVHVKRGHYLKVGDTIKGMLLTQASTLSRYKEHLDNIYPYKILKPREEVFIVQDKDTLVQPPKDEYGSPAYFGIVKNHD